MPAQYHLAFWNLENLFDIEGSPRREEKVARAIGKSIKGWTQALLDRKVSQLASIIRQMNGAHGPDMLGMAEVENVFVVDLLKNALAPLGRNYQAVHHDTPDRRGIDLAFIYDADLFEVPPGESVFSHFVLRRTATRDILQVNFKIKRKGTFFVVMGNHWPSRSGGEERSAGYRAIAGETLAYFHQRVLDIYGKSTPVLAMGDFNDEPSNTSLVDYALAVRERKNVTYARNPVFLNLMWPLMGAAVGSLYFDNAPNLIDQFLANKKTRLSAQGEPGISQCARLSGDDRHRTLPTPHPLWRHGQEGQPERLQRPLPHRSYVDGKIITRTNRARPARSGRKGCCAGIRPGLARNRCRGWRRPV